MMIRSKMFTPTLEKDANSRTCTCLVALREREKQEFRDSSVSTLVGVGNGRGRVGGGSGRWWGSRLTSSARSRHPSPETGGAGRWRGSEENRQWGKPTSTLEEALGRLPRAGTPWVFLPTL